MLPSDALLTLLDRLRDHWSLSSSIRQAFGNFAAFEKANVEAFAAQLVSEGITGSELLAKFLVIESP